MTMRGPDVMQDALFTVRSLHSFVVGHHPLQLIRETLNVALKYIDATFEE